MSDDGSALAEAPLPESLEDPTEAPALEAAPTEANQKMHGKKRSAKTERAPQASTQRKQRRAPLSSRHGEEVKLRRVILNKKLVLRSKAALDSKKLGDIRKGTTVLVVDEDLDPATGAVRVRLGDDSTPRGACVHNLGWVTACKDGEPKLTPMLEEGEEGDWSFLRGAQGAQAPPMEALQRNAKQASPSRPAHGSMASRIAKRRQELARDRHDKRSAQHADAPAAEETVSNTGAGPSDATESDTKESQAPKVRFELSTSESLLIKADEEEALAQEEEANAQATFDTIDAKLGRLLSEKNIKLETTIMKDWDRNNDGEISKQEFRLNVRKLGLDTATSDIDQLFESRT